MKKILLLFPLFALACNSGASGKRTSGTQRVVSSTSGGYQEVCFDAQSINGVTYHVFIGSNYNSIEVVNYTKDSLEIELLKIEISKYR